MGVGTSSGLIWYLREVFKYRLDNVKGIYIFGIKSILNSF